MPSISNSISLSHAKASWSSPSISSNTRSTSSTCAEFQALISYRSAHHVDPIITSSSKTDEPRHARRSVAICLLQEKSRSHGTDDAWDGRISRAIRARVGYTIALSYTEWLVFESPVRSGFLTPRAIDQDRDQSFKIQIWQKTGPDWYEPVFCGFLRLQDWSKPVTV